MSRAYRLSTNNSVSSLEKEMERLTAVEEARSRNNASIYEDIANILNPQKHTVESKVKELQERTGLKLFLEKQSKSNAEKKANLKSLKETNPELFNILIEFIKNRCETVKGMTSISNIQQEVLNTFRKEGLTTEIVFDSDLVKYIDKCISSNLNTSHDKHDYIHLSRSVPQADEEDASNTDFFHGIE